MADNAPTNVTTSPAPTPAPALSADALGEVRIGFAVIVLAIALALLFVGGYFVVNAATLGGTEDGPAESMLAGLRHKTVWPVVTWSVLFGLVGLGLGFTLITGKGRDLNSPGGLSRQLAILFLAGSVCAACIPLYLLVSRGTQLAINPFFMWGALVFGVLLAGGLILLGDAARADSGRLRLLLMGVGLALGAITFGLGVALVSITFYEDFGKGLDTWRKQPTVLLWPVAAYLAGLAVVFCAIQPAAPLVRKDQNIRRTVFGANLIVTTLLLLGVLALPNVLAYADPLTGFFGRSYDWTQSGVHALSDKTRNYLSNLREPVKVSVLLPGGHPVRSDMTTMLDNMRSLNSGFTYELIDTRTGVNVQKRMEMMEKYKFTDTSGVLVKTGKEDEKGDYVFIKERELADQNPEQRGRRAGPAYSFKGEAALLGALMSLSEGQMKIYFTSGHGEFALEGAPPIPGMKRPGGGGELNSLKMKLTDRESVKVEPLRIDRNLKEIPKDASVVVIARPRQPFSPDEVKVLRDYLRRERKMRKDKGKDKGDIERDVEDVTAGKLFILFDTITQREGGKTSVTPTGLESLMTDYGVKLGNDRILQAGRANPDIVIAVTDDDSPNPVAKAFNPDQRRVTLFTFANVRTVVPAAERKSGVDPLMLVLDQQGIWAETDFDLDAQKFAATLRKDPKLQAKVLSESPLCMAVAVSDRAAPPGMPMDAAHAPAMKDTPRMVVFGAASWISDEGLAGRDGGDRTALFTSCVSWLHDRAVSAGIDIKTKERQVYNVNIAPEHQTRLLLVPLGLMATAVLIAGLGVWVIRRR